MISSLTVLFIIFAAVIGSTAMGGVLVYLLSRIRRIESGPPSAPPSRALAEDLARLESELEAMRDDVSALSERLDFTERLLMKGDDPPGEGSP
jgi:hypothetical protein